MTDETVMVVERWIQIAPGEYEISLSTDGHRWTRPVTVVVATPPVEALEQCVLAAEGEHGADEQTRLAWDAIARISALLPPKAL